VYNSGGVYFQKFKSAQGCDSTVRLNLTLVKIDTSILVTTNSLKSNATGATYQWIDCNQNNAPIKNETFNAFIPQKSGNYAVILEDRGCTDTSNCYWFIVASTDNLNGKQLSIFPNPTSGTLTVQTDATLVDATIKIFDDLGQLKFQKTMVNGKELTIDLSGQASGIYFVQITESQQQYVAKIYKE
jgi:predicted carbohydrate-binding protein with CBM5 and CBM33 domain